MRSVSAFVLASRGIWSLVILLAANWHDMVTYFRSPNAPSLLRRSFATAASAATAASSTLDQAALSPHLNEVLRQELLFYTTQGIKTAVRQQQLDRESGKRSIGTFTSIKPGMNIFVRCLSLLCSLLFIFSFQNRSSSASTTTTQQGEGHFSFSFNEVVESRNDSIVKLEYVFVYNQTYMSFR